MTASAPDPDRPVRSVGRAFALYTTLRLLLFLAVWVLVQLLVGEPLLAIGVAVLVSAVASIPLLRPYRDDLNRATAARVERRRAERETLRSRLDDH